MGNLEKLKTYTLIIADDDPIHRLLLNIHFRELSLPILEASNGQDLLDIIEENSNKSIILILDLHMPDLDGYEVIQMMSENKEKFKNIKTIVLSGSNGLDADKAWMHDHVFGFVEKPINKTDMIEMIMLAAE